MWCLNESSQPGWHCSKILFSRLVRIIPQTYKVAGGHRHLSFYKDLSLPLLTTTENIMLLLCGLSRPTWASRYLSANYKFLMALQIHASIDQIPQPCQVLRGVIVERGKSHLPNTPAILRKLKGIWVDKDQSFCFIMLWAASVVTFFSFCRSVD